MQMVNIYTHIKGQKSPLNVFIKLFYKNNRDISVSRRKCKNQPMADQRSSKYIIAAQF